MVGLGQQFDLLLSDNTSYPLKLKLDEHVRAACGYLPIGVDVELNPWEAEAAEQCDAAFLGTNYQQLDHGAREQLFNRVAGALPGVLHLYGRGWEGNRVPQATAHPFVGQRDAAAVMRRARLTVSISLYNDLGRYSSDRLKRALMAGAVVALRRFPDMEGLGLRAGENCLVWETPEQLVELIRDFRRPERTEIRQHMRKKAAELGRARYSWPRVVEELLAIVRDYRARRGLR
jgi:hypothetical protein